MWEIFIDKLDSIDKHIMLLLNYDGGYLQDCFWQFMSSRILWVVPSLLFIIYVFKHFNHSVAIGMIIAMVVTVALCDQVSSSVLKPFFARLRPSHATELEGLLHLVNGYRGGQYGFVSSHAANSFGAVSLASLIIRRRWTTGFLITLALCVCYSRVYLGVHYPADVLCGGILGVLIGFCVYHAMRYTFNMTKRTKLRLALTICVFVVSNNNVTAEELNDSIPVVNQPDQPSPKVESKLDKFSSSRLYQMTYVGVPLVAAGLIVKSEDDHFRSLRNDYMPKFRNHTDDYMQFAPAAVMLGLKTAGVEGRSSWSRMLVSDAFSAMLMGGVVNTLKTTTHVTRPDGSNEHSFPSGHTATAFMTATMLSKEYGHKSPWISIGAYTTATATGLMRMANNKHWLSDVLTGAGIGILTTELGYWIGDLIFKNKGINHSATTDFQLDGGMGNPSFASLYVGLNVPLSRYDIDENNTFRTSSGSSVGLEGAYFFNPYLGIGGRFTVSNTALIVNGDKAEENSFDAVSLCGGSYFSYPLSQRWAIGSKLLCGFVHYPRLELSNVTVGTRNGVCFGSGLSCSFKANNNYGIRFFIDYNLQPSHNKASGEWMNTLACGASFALLL